MNFSVSNGGTQAEMDFGLSSIPADAQITSAILNVTPSANFVMNNSEGGSDCSDGGTILADQFAQINGCTVVNYAIFLDQFTLDGLGAGITSLSLAGPGPVSIDPSYIQPGGIYPLTIVGSGIITFTGWEFPGLDGSIPPVLSLSGSGSATGDLTITYSEAPEPGTATLVAGSFGLIVVAAQIRRRRQLEMAPAQRN